jgi:ubiquinone/menaquinone biosynthesis C-methylase UbiE
MAEGGTELWIRQTIPEKGMGLVAGKERLVSTYRPLEMMFAATGKEPDALKGKEVLNVGAGKTHWGFELTEKYKVVAGKFDNFDISYAEQPIVRRLAGKLFAAETVGDVRKQLPFKDDSYDIVWCSYAPANWAEFVRVAKPGGEIFVLGGDASEERAKALSEQLHEAVISREIDQRSINQWSDKVSNADRGALDSMVGKRILVIKKQTK